MIPGHYMVRIRLSGKRTELHDTITWFSRLLPIGTGIDADELKKDEILILLPTPRLEGLSDEAILTVEGYSISADDTGSVAHCTRILINGKPPKTLGAAFKKEAADVSSETKQSEQDDAGQPATAVDSKAKGKKKTKPKSEGRSQ